MKRLSEFGAAGSAGQRYSLVPALLLVLSGFALTTAAPAAELVINGGFEDPIVDPAVRWMTYYGENQPFSEPDDCPADNAPDHCNDDVRIPGWSVFWTDEILEFEQLNPGRLEIQSGDIAGSPAFEGVQKAELDSHHRVGNDNNNVTIAQILPTCPRTEYTLNYAWKSRTTIPNDNDVRVVIGSELVNLHEQNEAWEEETLHFVSDNTNETILLFGSIGSETTTGMFLDGVSVTGPDGSDLANCAAICGDKPLELTLRYDGDDDSDHNQTGNEVIISPIVVPSFPPEATILVFDHNKRRPSFLGEFTVAIGEYFTVSGLRKRIPPRLTFEIYDEAFNLMQSVTFHTSCSQPLDAGDEFGAITVFSALN